MFTRLTTVRAKLTALVALSIVVMLAALPILSWILHGQMLDEVDDRVVEARRSFLTELDDDLADLTLAGRVLAQDEGTRNAIAARDRAKAGQMAATFVGVYPGLDVLLFDAEGLVAQVGCDLPPQTLQELGSDPRIAAGTFRGVIEHGCEKGSSAPAAMVLTAAIGGGIVAGQAAHAGGGVAVVCMPLDVAYVTNTSGKLGVELSLTRGNVRFASSPAFPLEIPNPGGDDSSVAELGSHTWAVTSFEALPLAVPQGAPIRVIDALDVTDVQRIIRRNLLYALLVLLVAAGASVSFGSRLASMMSQALARVDVALKKLAQQEYVHVDAVKTGDELEDLAEGFNRMVDGLKERDHLKMTMGKYMTASVMAHLLGGRVHLGGETLNVTILFSDIRSFTTISEKMNAQELVGLLNEYFTEMVGIVMDSDGVVDKYIGDAIMAVFGAPVPKSDDPVRAVTAAVRMRQSLQHLNVRLAARGAPPLRTGIGIHTGEVVAGNIGSERRMEYTVIGDAVNLASRLESNTKELGVSVLISEDTWELVKHAVVARPVKEITVKGRKQPVMTYQVLGLVGEPALDEHVSGSGPETTHDRSPDSRATKST
ncbi:MAG TPA: adenylate/guanylate cyclase domain-containing protein [Polyangiaceae bacterium]|jgi:adenylate cyclase